MQELYYIRFIQTGEFFSDTYQGELNLSKNFEDAINVNKDLSDLSYETIEDLKDYGTIELITILR